MIHSFIPVGAPTGRLYRYRYLKCLHVASWLQDPPELHTGSYRYRPTSYWLKPSARRAGNAFRPNFRFGGPGWVGCRGKLGGCTRRISTVAKAGLVCAWQAWAAMAQRRTLERVNKAVSEREILLSSADQPAEQNTSTCRLLPYISSYLV